MTWGLREGYVRWLLRQGYSVASINNRLSAVKVYARLATRAGVIPAEEHALIREVRGYGETEGKRVNEQRVKSRVGHKKDEAIVLTAEQARLLKTQHTTSPQGTRDRLLICLLLDLGLRASEVAALRVEDFAEPGYVTVRRLKTDTVDHMELSVDVFKALAAYASYQRKEGLLLPGSRKNEELTEQNMSVRAIGGRVKILGRDILALWELSPHDLRHTHNPQSPVFKRGIHIAQRWFNGSWLPPAENGYSRAVPLRWLPAFSEKSRPQAAAPCKEWEATHAFLLWVRQQLVAHGRPAQQLLLVADGHFDTLNLWRGLPAGVILLARSAKNRALWHLPAASARKNRQYGERAPTPADIWRQRRGWQPLNLQVRGRTRHLQVKVAGPFVRKGAAHRPVFLMVVRGKSNKRTRRSHSW